MFDCNFGNFRDAHGVNVRSEKKKGLYFIFSVHPSGNLILAPFLQVCLKKVLW